MLYLHIPFCLNRCIYCDFYSTVSSPELRSRFVTALCEELKMRSPEAKALPLQSIYIGGGTPSTLDVRDIERIFSTIRANYTIAREAELTFEANPDDITPEKVAALRAVGVNRVSLGVQSFDDNLLRLLRRRHNGMEARRAVKLLVEGGITNVSIDLIYGLPGQTLETFRRDLDTAFTLPIKHLSSYALSVEQGTQLSQMIERGELSYSDEELFLLLFEALLERCEAEGFRHYEISNFALPDFHSRHNSAYWNGTPYIGVGPGAHSFDGRFERRLNLPDLKGYINNPGLPPYETESLTLAESFDETVFTSLRTVEGLSLHHLLDRYGNERYDRLLRDAAPALAQGLLRIDKAAERLRLTRKGIFVSDNVMSDLMQGVDEENVK